MSLAFTTSIVDSEGVSLATRDYGGDGPPLVLMHGAGMEQGSLELLVEQLRGTIRVVTFDFRGHGRTGRAPWTFASAVRDVTAVAQAHGLGVPAVAGHSLGGMVATLYGLQHPTCPGVINIDGHGRGRVDQYLGYEEKDVRQLWERQDRRIDLMTRGPGAAALKGLLFLLRKKPTSTGETLRQVMREVDKTDLLSLYPQLSCPLLVFNATAREERRLMRLWAGRGPTFVAALRRGLSRDLAALSASKELVQIVTMDATHMLIRTHPEFIAQQLQVLLQLPEVV